MRAALIAATIGGALFAAPTALSSIYTVNSAADTNDGVCDVLDCTLREAITAVDLNPDPSGDFINFQIGIGGSFTIAPGGAGLPRIDNPVTIDATTQTGYVGAPLITVDGANTSSANGFEVDTSGTTIRGFAIGGFTTGSGVLLDGAAGNNTIAGNYIGVDAGGGTANPNAVGISALTSSNTLGGATVGVDGSAPDRNVISGNLQDGINIAFGVSNTVQGNYIGLDASGSFAVPNMTGILVQSDGNDIGVSNQPWPNVVSGNTVVGIEISGGSDNAVFANYVGTDGDGRSALPNGAGGVQVIGGSSAHADGNRIGESGGGGNIISGNTGAGVLINGFGTGAFANNNDVEANSIGVDADGNPLGNSGSAGAGVLITTGAGNGNTIGSLSPAGGGNTIANNSGPGVKIEVGVDETVVQNEISNNGGLGIDLSPNGVTPNDPDDTDTGVNDLLNFPAVGSVTRLPEGSVTLTGTYDGGTAGATYRLDFYASTACDGSGNGEGEHWLGTIDTEPADGSGDATYDTGTSLAQYVAPGSAITATATDAAGNTSEFSACKTVSGNTGPDLVVNTTADTDDGSCDPAPGGCTLREALNQANADPNLNTIKFALPDPPFTITVTDPTPFPRIDTDMIIDGNTQPGTTPGTPQVRLDGTGQSATPIGLDVEGGLDGSVIRGLSVTDFKTSGITLEGPPSVVEGSYLGLTPNGSVAGNGSGDDFHNAGIIVASDHNLVGGGTPAARNVISGNAGDGVLFESNGFQSVIRGNYIGTTVSGLDNASNTADGIRGEDATAQIIGGTSPGEGNLISGNGADGIFFNGGFALETGTIEGNTIGLASDGIAQLGNAGAGINVDGIDSATSIGGTAPGAGNVISGNGGAGISLDASDDVQIQGNLIGLTAAGDAPVGNGASQLTMNNSDNVQIGGTTSGARNVISGAGGGAGVIIDGQSLHATVQGNYIGTDKTGQLLIGNQDGINVTGGSQVTIGGAVPGARNVISGNLVGIRLDFAGNDPLTGVGSRILGNSIGTDAGESSLIPNDVGIEIHATFATTVGSTSPGAGNVIAGSDDTGIIINGGSDSNTIAANYIGTDRTGTKDWGNGTGIRFVSGGGNDNLIGPDNVIAHSFDVTTGYGIEMNEGTGNRISANSIHDNLLRGIFLNSGGGANNGQASPTLTSAIRSGSTTTIEGTLSTNPSTSYFIEYFATPSCTGQPQGQKYLGFQTVTTDGTGQASLSFGTPLAAAGEAITATATSQTTKDTSEFSSCATVAGSGLLHGRVHVSGDPPTHESPDLTAVGTADWAVWGYANGGTSTSLAPDVRKAGGSAISDLTDINPSSVNRRGIGQFAEPYGLSWSNGSGPASATNATAGLQHDGQTQALSTLNHGFSFDLPAGTSARTVRIYVLTNRADGELTASLSDGSAPTYVNTLPHGVNTRIGVYTIAYAAASAGQTLHVQWIETADFCAISGFHCDNAAIFAVAVTDPSTLVVTDPGDAGGSTCGTDCTLRQAINTANLAPGSRIIFALPDGSTTISPGTNLPALTAPTTIDATTQPGYDGSPVVTLDGSNDADSPAYGFVLGSDTNTIRGFTIVDFGDDGIFVADSNGNTIAGNYIGIDVGGINSQNNGNGITVTGDSSGNTIGGTTAQDRNVISGNGGYGIDLSAGGGNAPSNNVISGNYIGLRPDGTGTQGVSGNVNAGIRVQGDSNTIGGTTPGARNYISANDDDGITIQGSGNAVKGNIVGLDVSGNGVANSGDGIDVTPFATDVANVIGGLGPGDGNVISGNSQDGVFLQSPFAAAPPGTTVQGNLIGTDPTGTTAIGNGLAGIETNDGGFNQIDHNTISGNLGDGIYTTGFDSNNNVISLNMIGTNSAGTAAVPNQVNGVEFDFASGTVSHNVISGNVQAGVMIGGAVPPSTVTTVTGNKIGTNAAGTQALGNATGVQISGTTDSAIGGPNSGDGNTISGNVGAGVDIAGQFTSSNTVSGNTIGLDSTGTTPVPNATGVMLETGANANTIGGPTAADGNVISGNSGGGVQVQGGSTVNNTIRKNTIRSNGGAGVAVPGAPPLHTTISANSIDLNGGLGIDLGTTGVTPNDSPDTDHFQNFPTITGATGNAVTGTLASVPSTTFNIELFVSPACDASGRGEGRTYLATTTVVTDASGNGSFTANVGTLPSGQVVTGTATNPTGDTSEFSNCVATTPPVLAQNLTLTPTPNSSTAGAAQVKLANVPPLALILPQSGQQTAPVNQSPVNQSPVNQSPVNQTPVNQLAGTNAPVNQTPINQSPVNQSPVNQSGFAELTQSIPQLGSITLSTIPLMRSGGWAALLTNTSLAGLPEQSVTLRQVFALNPLPGPLQPGATNPIKIGELDLSRSPLGTAPAMAFALGKLPLSQIPVGTGTGATTFTAWCTSANVTGVDCTGTTQQPATVLSTSIQGAPVNQSPVNQSPVNQSLIQQLAAYGAPVNQTPVNQTPINQSPVNQSPVNQSRIGALPVNQTPVNQTPVNQSPINQLSLQPILANNAPVNQSPVNQTPVNQLSNPNAMFYCLPSTPPQGQTAINCSTATLKDAVNSVRAGVTLGDLRIHAPLGLPGWTISDLRYYGNMTIGDLLLSLPQPNSFTLADVLFLVLGSPDGAQGLSFEGINIFDTNLQAAATGGPTVAYRATFTLNAQGGPTGVQNTVSVNATLAKGFYYVPGSSKLLQGATCTGATTIADPTATKLTDGSLKLTWAVNATVGTNNANSTYSVCFTMRPSLFLGPQGASLDAQPTGGSNATATPTSVNVGDTLESNDTASTSPTVANDSFYLSYLTSASDVDYYRFTAPTTVGTVLTFHLSHLPADYDLVVYGPQGTALRPPLSTGAVPLDEPPMTDTGVDITSTTSTLPSQTLDDLRLQTDLPMVGVSASRGTDPEDVVVISQGPGTYTVQITGYNGATSDKPYMLRVATAPPRATSNVSPTTVTGTVGPALPNLPTGLNTVFLVNRQRLQNFYGDTRATNVMNALSSTSAGFTSLGYPNVVLSVDRYSTALCQGVPAVQTAYASWNANPGSPTAANSVVQAINCVIDSQIRSQPNGAGLKYLVIVGGDQIIPFARLDDFTVTAANEQSYANTFGTNSDLFAALNAGQMLSDDPYGDVNPVPYLTRQLYIPELSVGRLVERPEDIVQTLNNFISPAVAGHLDPTTSLTTGYDFLYDGAQAVNAPFSSPSRFGTNAKALLDNPAVTGDSWTLSQLIGAFLPTATGTSSPSITSLNGHASHFQFQPPNNDVTGAAQPLLTTLDMTSSSSSLANRLIFSMGCHAGLSVADSIVTGTALDWPQAFAQKNVGAFLGNTGYGYGDSLVVAYSEELNNLFAQRMAAGSAVGDALASAKQAYYGELGVFGVYDEKAMAEFTLYGLPMWKVSGPPAGTGQSQTQAFAAAAPTGAPQTSAVADTNPSAQSAPITTDPTTGLDTEAFNLGSTANPIASTRHDVPPFGSYWSGPDGVQTTHFRPIQPKALVGLSGTTGHGALITELSSNDTNCIDPVFDRPIVDLSDNERELRFADVAFPSKIQTVRTFETPNGRVQQLVLVTGQFFTQACAANPDPQVGVQRLFSHIAGRVFRSASNDYFAPAFTRIDAIQAGGNAAFTIDVTDKVQGGGAGTVKQVLVAVRSGGASDWTFANLAQQGTTSRWTGGIGITGTQFEYFVQAVDANGNVGVSTNKGFYFAGALPPPPPPPNGGFTAQLNPTQPASGWYGSPPTLTVTPDPGVTVQASVDGGTYGPPPTTITGDGLHRIDFRASTGATGTLFAPVDTTAPTITINTPVAGAQYVQNSAVKADYVCKDAGSGVASCPATNDGTSIAYGANIDTSTLGPHSFTVGPATDRASHTANAVTITYNVVRYRRVIFSSARTGNGDIYAMNVNADGSANGNAIQLTSGSALDEQPSWSPDGSKIAFARATAKNNLDIYVMDSNGANIKQLTSAANDDTAPAWSADGSKIAFQSKRDGNPEIYVMNNDGTNQRRLTFNTTQDAEPSWSPNGQKITFLSNRTNGILNVWVMDSSGANQKPLTTTSQPDATPSFSPDGTKILFASKRGTNSGTTFDIYTMSSDGSNVIRLTNTKGGDFEPAWSRDGTRIAFTSLRDGNQEIYTRAPTPMVGALRLTNNAAIDNQPDW